VYYDDDDYCGNYDDSNGYGYGTKTTISETAKKLTRFTIAFQEECAV